MTAEENNTDKALMDLMVVQRSVSRDDGDDADVLFNVLGIILWLGKWTLSVCTGFCLCVHQFVRQLFDMVALYPLE